MDEVERYAELQQECAQLGRRVSVANGMFMGFIFAASNGALFLVFNSGGRAVASGRMTSGELTNAKETTAVGVTQLDHSLVDKISLTNVTFAYKSNLSNNILRDINLSLERGQVVGLVGKNGSGKSSIASLLA
eukprot:scaffold219921_cov43-Attheya_sp.AAC.1